MISTLLTVSASMMLSLSILALSVPTLAADHTLDRYGSRSGFGAGIYLRLPFMGGLRRPPANGSLQYGLKMGFERYFRASPPLRGELQRIDFDILTLRFGAMGFENFSVTGQDIIKYNTMRLEAKGSKTNWTNLGIGVIVAGATVGVAVLASTSTSNAAPTAN